MGALYKQQTELDFPTVAACTSAQQRISGFIHRGNQEESRYWGLPLPLGSSRLPIGIHQTPTARVVTILRSFLLNILPIRCLLGYNGDDHDNLRYGIEMIPEVVD